MNIKWLLLLLVLVAVPSWSANDLPTLPAPGLDPSERAMALDAVNVYRNSLRVWTVNFTYEMTSFRKPEKPVTDIYEVEMTEDGDLYRYKLDIQGDKPWFLVETHREKSLWTLFIGKTAKGWINDDVDGQVTMHNPIFDSPYQELKQCLTAGGNVWRAIQFTHVVTGLDTKKYPASSGYIWLGAKGWLMAFLDKERGYQPIALWRGSNHTTGHSTTSFSHWLKDSNGRPYPSDMVEEFYLDGKLFSRVHVAIKHFSPTVDPAIFKVLEEKFFPFPKQEIKRK